MQIPFGNDNKKHDTKKSECRQGQTSEAALSDGSELDRQEFGTDIGEVRHEPARRGLRLYVAVLLATPFVLIVATVFWMSRPVYLEHAQYAYLADMGYGMQLRHADCDVLVYGDSTALIGVEPRVIEQMTGLKTCNIAEVAGVQVTNGLMVLDTYLEHNRRPRYVVFEYAPENFNDPANWTEVSTFEGEVFRLQFRPDAAFARSVLHDPDEIITDAELGLRTGLQWLVTPKLPAATLNIRQTSHGRVPEPGPQFTECPPVLAERPPDAQWIAALRQKYAVGGTRVLVDVTPAPACDPTRPFYDERFKPGMLDNTLGTLPLDLYAYTGRLHTNDAGAVELSRRIGEQIVQHEKGGR
jgi:hypothetical protein